MANLTAQHQQQLAAKMQEAAQAGIDIGALIKLIGDFTSFVKAPSIAGFQALVQDLMQAVSGGGTLGKAPGTP